MNHANRLEDALDYLLQQIDNNEEYPDAEYRAARKFNVDAEELRAKYDDVFATP